MPDLKDGESVEMKGSGAKPYVLKNVGGVYSCTCPAWRNQSKGIESRTCKHLRKLRGDAAEEERIGSAVPVTPQSKEKDDSLKPQLLLAEKWDNETDLTGWWMSEKLDGVRAYWDGKQLISRLGNVFVPPDWFIKDLPDFPLDGELWTARKQFNRCSGIVRRKDKPDLWKEVSFLVFDAPGLDEPFEQRMKHFQTYLKKTKPPHAQSHDHVECKDVDHLRKELKRVEELGGEGLMLREPASKYICGRSTCLLKVKTFHDAEAKVIRHVPGKGRHKGRMGALEVKLEDGTVFSVGTGFSDAQRENPPEVGAVITFRYQELSEAGVPRFPSFVRAAKIT